MPRGADRATSRSTRKPVTGYSFRLVFTTGLVACASLVHGKGTSLSRPAIVVGCVVDSEGGAPFPQPVPGMTIILRSTGDSARTDSTGFFRLSTTSGGGPFTDTIVVAPNRKTGPPMFYYAPTSRAVVLRPSDSVAVGTIVMIHRGTIDVSPFTTDELARFIRDVQSQWPRLLMACQRRVSGRSSIP
jgi:hypothetical protein